MTKLELTPIAEATQPAPSESINPESSATVPNAAGPESETLPNGQPVFTFRESGRKIGANALSLARYAGELCTHLNQCDFAQWNKAKADFLEGAKSAGYLSDDIWDRAIAACKPYGLKAKPTTPVVESAERSERRKAQAEALAKLTEGKTVAELASETETRAREFGTVSAGVVVAAQALESAKTEKAKAKAAADLAAAQAKAKMAQDLLRQVQQARDKAAHDAAQAATDAAKKRMSELRKALRDLIPTATEAELIAAIKCIKPKPVSAGPSEAK